MVSWLAVWALLGAQAAAKTTWEAAFEANPLPVQRNHVEKDYFVAVLESPDEVPEWRLEEPMPIPDHWLFSVPKGQSHDGFESLAKRSRPPVVYEAKLKRLHKRLPLPVTRDTGVDMAAIENEFDIHDPFFESQWHIVNNKEAGNDMNLLDVWRRNITGLGVTVAIIDDGLDSAHPDLQNAFSLEGSWDYNDHQNLPEPKLSDDRHGTRCAGEIAAAHNEFCGVGVAPGAQVAGIRILSGQLTDADEARAMIHGMDTNSIYSCSWGPNDNGRTVEAPPLVVKRAILEGIESGRQGKGSIYVFAAGNGHFSGDNCNYDGYTNSIYSITVAAADRTNKHPYYGESCSANMITTYSSNSQDKITTCDRSVGRDAKDSCTSDHSGTSAAAPLAAGVFALVLQQRDDLTWRDMQYLCRDTAKKFDLEEGLEWQITHDGKQYHNHFGFGLLDADALVKRAETWELVGPQSWFIGEKREVNAPIKGEEPVEFTYTISQEEWDAANLEHIEHVNLVVSTEYPVRGGVRYSLKSPSGFVSELAARRFKDSSKTPLTDWQFMSVAHWGENGVGNWTVIVEGMDNQEGILKDVKIKLWGLAKDPSKVKRFSEVWDQYESHVDAEEYTPANELPVESSEPTAAGPTPVSQEPPVMVPAPTDVAETEPETKPEPEPKPDEDGDESENEPEPVEDDGENDEDSENGEDDEDKPSPHHSIWYYLGVTAVGTGILAAIGLPIGWWYFRRSPRFTIDDADFALIPSDVELSDMGEFGISSDGEDDNQELSDGDELPNAAGETGRYRDSEHLLH